MFLNCSNHPSDKWPTSQRQAALAFGQIVDLPFPAVPTQASQQEIKELAITLLQQILALKPSCVMLQGEFTLSYALIHALRLQGILVVAACSERRVAEETLPDGTVRKSVEFAFASFREYKELEN